MAERDECPEEDNVDTTENDATAAADTAELKGHLAFEGDREAMTAVDALHRQGARLGEGSHDDKNPQPDPEFRAKLRDRLVDEGTEGGDDHTEKE